MKRSQWKWLLVSLSFSALVMAGVLYFTVDESTIEYLSRINPYYLVLAVLLHLLSLGFWALRIQKMSASLGYRVHLTHCVNLVLANMLVAAVTPSQAGGGEPVRIHELYRAGVPVGGTPPPSSSWSGSSTESSSGGARGGLRHALPRQLLEQPRLGGVQRAERLMYAAWIFVTLFVLVFVYSVKNPDHLKRVLKGISRWIDRRWHLKRLESLLETIDREVDNFNRGLVRFVNHGKSGLVWGMLFTLLFWVSEFVVASMLLIGLGQPPHISSSRSSSSSSSPSS
ncbi:flippase-like domain-containing protein [Methanoculleus chikugoensis]|uniref:flippase-like domain-containing protein n=1 Tax=Methanoculleus chikugoensis TaxID=118126 RepID=UPI000A6ECF43|nr:flippase-like domain-containing protein [Methanoculleus chikugoensis]